MMGGITAHYSIFCTTLHEFKSEHKSTRAYGLAVRLLGPERNRFLAMPGFASKSRTVQSRANIGRLSKGFPKTHNFELACLQSTNDIDKIALHTFRYVPYSYAHEKDFRDAGQFCGRF